MTDEIKRVQKQMKEAYDAAMKETQASRSYLEQIRLQAQQAMQGAIDERI